MTLAIALSALGALLVVAGLLLVWVTVALGRWRRRVFADRDKPILLNRERAEVLRRLSAAEYGQFLKRRNGAKP